MDYLREAAYGMIFLSGLMNYLFKSFPLRLVL